jgi:2-polyprenyl-3-methyl-5-hydroxy-6-metoxy-1,4-benzoquinol methylase
MTQNKADNFSNKEFWNERYITNPELGSGVGSRGEILEYKRKLIYPYLNYFSEDKILDVGFGDLELMKDGPNCNYTGFDVSDEAVKIAKLKRPDWAFYSGELDELKKESYNLVMCFDVLIHQTY